MNAPRMLSQRTLVVVVGMLTCLVAAPSQSQTPPAQAAPAPEKAPTPSLLPNPSFEEMAGKEPKAWTAIALSGGGRFAYPTTGHEGSHCIESRSDTGGDLCWEVRLELEPYTTYKLKGWIKTEAVSATDNGGAALELRGASVASSPRLTGNHDWTEMETTLDTADNDYAFVRCSFGGTGKAKGVAYFDQLSLEIVSRTQPKPSLDIDCGKAAAPISKYTYGQFIEHLGNCIQSGIWAEMLEDRKFFQEVGVQLANGDRPAWQMFLGVQPDDATKVMLGGSVKMTKDNPYVGEQAALVIMDGKPRPVGIVQDAVGIRKDQTYKGYVVLAGDPAAAPIEVALIWGARNEGIQTFKVDTLTQDYKRYEFTFTPGVDTRDARFRVAGYGSGQFRIGEVSMMPTDNVDGMRADTLALVKELGAPVYRWPGGNFVSGYDWHDGIGDRDKRPPRKNPAWKGTEQNDFGMHEFMNFCRIVGAEPYIAVNTGLGDPKAAAEEVAYANAPADTPQGKLRAANGHPEPFGVKWWGVGNEMYGDWQLGHVPLEEYVKRHIAFAEAMRAVDPAIKLIGVGATGKWSETMLAQCGKHMDLLSEHFYCHELPGVYAHSRQIADQIRNKTREHRKYLSNPALEGKVVPIAMDEWNYWYGPEIYGQIGTRYFWKDGLGIAAGLHEYFRNTDIIAMANYAQTVNVIGAIKTTDTAAAFETTGLVLKLYRQHFGTIPVALTGDSKPVDASAAWTEDHGALTVAVVNATRQAYDLPLNVQGAKLAATGRAWTIASADPRDFNQPGKDPKVKIEETADVPSGPTLAVPPLSVRLYEWKASK